MKINISVSAVRESSWLELALRFALGGLVTALAGLIGHEFGPVIGGLFLAFPSIFPASVTLVETHEASKRRKHGLSGSCFARRAAGADAAGAAVGNVRIDGIWWCGLANRPPIPSLDGINDGFPRLGIGRCFGMEHPEGRQNAEEPIHTIMTYVSGVLNAPFLSS
jgi:hypothetical protein